MNISNNKKSKISLTLAVIILVEALIPGQLLALTSGPTQPEFSSFQPINSTDMVDLFTGDFKYNIPLLNVPGHQGGYPINLFYNSVTNVEEEASMVGLGWNLGIGNISRTVRGVPDDFNGEIIKRETHIKPQINVGASFRPNVEVLGADGDKIVKHGFTQTFSMNYDNYNGIGFGLGLNLNLSNSKMAGSFGLNSDSFNGLSYSGNISANFDIKKKENEKVIGTGGLGIAGNSIDGITGISFNQKINNPDSKTTNKDRDFLSISDRPTYISTGDLEFTGTNLNISTKGGLEVFGVTGNALISGFITERKLKNKYAYNKAFGVMYAENGQDHKTAITDFNRIGDKAIHSKTAHLPIGVQTEDIYTVTGHGTGGSFSFHRDDTGTFKDQYSSSKTVGATIHLEAAGGNLFGVGGDFGANYSYTDNKAHKVLTDNTKFTADMSNSTLEKGHFRMSGEVTGDIFAPGEHPRANTLKRSSTYLGKDEHLTPGINNSKFMKRATLQNNLLYRSNGVLMPLEDKKRTNRNPRQTVINRYLKKDIWNLNDSIIIPYLKVKVNALDNPGSFTYSKPTTLRTPLISKTQIEAFEELNAQGQRYIYGLPLKNIKKREVSFALANQMEKCSATVDIPLTNNGKIDHYPNQPGTDEFLNITETPEFAHSYLLTSILGDNYIDIDPNDGLPSDKDRGYWVNFYYTKTSGNSNYKYRVPFKGAQLNPGFHSITSDDKASYTYGEREQAYISAIETNSHIATFYYSKRDDGRGANSEFQNINEFGAFSYKLDSIQLNTKSNIKEKTVIFKYKTTGLCPGIPNSAMPQKGKLTLESVCIYNYNNTRGKLNPYVFDYYDATGSVSYGERNFDRWGVYKSDNINDLCKNYYEPYTDQINANQDASVFHLKSITLPSGAKINLDVSRDHYAHVQDKAATEMVKLTGVSTNGTNIINSISDFGRDVYFNARPNTTLNDYISNLYEDENGKQIIFKLYSDMLQPGSNNFEYVTGAAYVDIQNSSVNETVGKIRLKPLNLPVKISTTFNQHPFLISNWQFLKVNLRKLLSPGVNVVASNGVKSEAIKTFQKIIKLVDNVLDIFKGFYANANSKQYGYKIDLEKSFIRLNTPEQKKYGGGIKVDKITMSDIWDKEGVDIKYGQIYIYDTKVQRSNGSYYFRSNGVATNEPFLGKEENSLYFIENFKDDLLFTTDVLYYEMMPANDMNLPGPSVGYSKVTVRSLPSNDMALKAAGQTSGLPSYLNDPSNDLNVSTTGESVNEFYTAKDFPIVFESSSVNKSGYTPTWFPLIFVGFINHNAYTATQSYMCETNDMHGKPLRVSYYSQSKNGEITADPVSYVEYQYNYKDELYNWGKTKMVRKRLVNDNIDLQVDFLQNPINNKKTYKGELGVDRSLTTDVRFVQGESSVVGLSPGVNSFLAIIFPAAIPYAFPNLVYSTTTLETAVTNKHITKKGIMTKMIAYDGQSKVETENLVFDPYTGSPVMSTLTDHFDQKKYNQTYPAYLGYDRMGPAYTNIGMTFDFSGTVQRDPCSGFHALRFNGSLPQFASQLVPGDEFIVEMFDTPPGKSRAIFQKSTQACCAPGHNFLLFSFSDSQFINANQPTGRMLKFTCYRSGNRNLINSDGQSVTSLSNTNLPNISKVLSASANTYCDFWQYNEPVDNTCTGTYPLCVDLQLDTIGHIATSYSDIKTLAETLYAFRSNTNSINHDKKYGSRMELPNVGRTYFKFNTDPVETRLSIGHTINSCSLKISTLETPIQPEIAKLYRVMSNWNGSYSNMDWISKAPLVSSSFYSFDQTTPVNNTVNLVLSNSYSDWSKGFCLKMDNEDLNSNAYASLHGNASPNNGFHPIITVCFNQGTNDPCNITGLQQASSNDQFRSGAKGIFRMESQYNYRSKRNNNSTASSTSVKEKGIFIDSYSPFEWKNPLFFNSLLYQEGWLVSNKVTKRNISGDVLETKNALNLYNSAIYVPVVTTTPTATHAPNVIQASTKNAQYHETACTSFETYEQYNIPTNGINWNNFDIYHLGTNSQEKYKILESGTNYIIIDKKYNQFNRYLNQKVEVYTSEKSANLPFSSFDTYITSESLYTNAPYSGMTKLTLADVLDCDKIDSDAPDKAIISRSNSALTQPTNISYDNNFAHTGKRSLKVTGNTVIQNKTLDLYKNKKYYASCWVYLNNANLSTLKNEGITVSINSIPLSFIGNRINGWQQVAGEFTLTTLPSNNVSININKGIHPEIYIDDFRIHPYEASMQAYVYDSGSYLLTYILDDNNFYSRYIYDSEGKLISIRKETERGVKALQEQRTYLKPIN